MLTIVQKGKAKYLTLYTPALRKNVEADIAINQISNFVENIRLEQSYKRASEMNSENNTPERRA